MRYQQVCVWIVMMGLIFSSTVTYARDKAHEKHPGKHHEKLNAVITDIEGVNTRVEHVEIYWEEQIDETSFVPHNIHHISVKRGKATVDVPLRKIKKIEIKPHQGGNGSLQLTITLNKGKTSEFPLAREVSLIGKSDFGKIKIPMKDLKTIEIQ